jgi:hypothetical protein
MEDDFLEFYNSPSSSPKPLPLQKKFLIPDIKNYRIERYETCKFCEKTLPKRTVIHKNICQEHTDHKFCSRDCKEKWCYEKIQERKNI